VPEYQPLLVGNVQLDDGVRVVVAQMLAASGLTSCGLSASS